MDTPGYKLGNISAHVPPNEVLTDDALGRRASSVAHNATMQNDYYFELELQRALRNPDLIFLLPYAILSFL